MFSEQPELWRQQDGVSECIGGQQHGDQGRKDALDAAAVECRERDATRRQQYPRDQKARDDEEDVNADEAAGQHPRVRVIADDQQD